MTQEACRTALERVALVLSEHLDSMVLVGGNVPPLLFPEAAGSYCGTVDIDLVIDLGAQKKLAPKGLDEKLLEAGFRRGGHPYAWELEVSVGEVSNLLIRVDFISGEPGELKGIEDFRDFMGVPAVRMRGAALAFLDTFTVTVGGAGRDAENASIRVSGIVPFLSMKGMALEERFEPKDAWDTYFCVKNHPGGADAFAEVCHPFMEEKSLRDGFEAISRNFSSPGGKGPRFVADFEGLVDDAEREILKRDACERLMRLTKLLDISGK